MQAMQRYNENFMKLVFAVTVATNIFDVRFREVFDG